MAFQIGFAAEYSEKKPAEAFAENEEKAEDAPDGIEEEKKENGQQEEASPNEG